MWLQVGYFETRPDTFGSGPRLATGWSEKNVPSRASPRPDLVVGLHAALAQLGHAREDEVDARRLRGLQQPRDLRERARTVAGQQLQVFGTV